MKIKLIAFSILFVSMGICGNAQTGFSSSGGANFLGLARAGVAYSGAESIYLNQAGMTSVGNMAFDVSAERRYNLQELTQVSVAAMKSFKIGTLGIMASNFGFNAYNEQKFGLAYARKLSKAISLGGQMDMLRYNIENIGSKNSFSFEAGLIANISDQLALGTHVFSPIHVNINDIDIISTRFRLGLKYAPSDKVFILAEADKTIDKDMELKFGVSYTPLKVLSVLAGFNTALSSFHFGASLSIQETYKIKTAVGSSHLLGNTPAISLQYLP